MNKAGLVEQLAVHFNGNKAEAGRALEAMMSTIMQLVAQGEHIVLTGFGVFEYVHRPDRLVRNPATGSSKPAPAIDIPRFRPGLEFKQMVADTPKNPVFTKPRKNSRTQ